MILRILFFILVNSFIFSVTAWSQETVAKVELKYGTDVSEVFFLGDTMLVRLMWSAQTTAKPGSDCALYAGTQKIADIDLMALGRRNLVAVKRYGDSLYYYAADEAGKKVNIDVYNSVGTGAAFKSGTTVVAGVLVNALERGNEMMVITWERKATTVHLYWINRDRLINTRDLKLPKDLVEIREKDIAFVSKGDQSRVSSTSVPFKIFVYDDTFCAVYDDTWREYNTVEKPGYRTRTFRKNLVTGKEDSDLFFTSEKYAFKSYLSGQNGQQLHRLVTTKNDVTLYVHDLDSNRVVMQQKITASPDNLGLERWGSEHKIATGKEPDLRQFMATDVADIGIVVDDYRDGQVVTYGSYYNGKGAGFIGNPVYGVAQSIAVLVITTAIKQMKDDPNHIRYQYLQGTPQTGFKVLPAGESRDFIKTRIDEFELDAQKKGDIDHLSYLTSDRYWVAIYSYRKSPVYSIVRFPVKP